MLSSLRCGSLSYCYHHHVHSARISCRKLTYLGHLFMIIVQCWYSAICSVSILEFGTFCPWLYDVNQHYILRTDLQYYLSRFIAGDSKAVPNELTIWSYFICYVIHRTYLHSVFSTKIASHSSLFGHCYSLFVCGLHCCCILWVHTFMSIPQLSA